MRFRDPASAAFHAAYGAARARRRRGSCCRRAEEAALRAGAPAWRAFVLASLVVFAASLVLEDR